jgi:hypothetical protein
MKVVPPYPKYPCFRRPTRDLTLLAVDLSTLSYEDDPFIRKTLSTNPNSPFLLGNILTSGDIQAIVARCKWPCDDPSTSITFVAFRGTTTLTDWIVDFDFPLNENGIHRGFYDAAMPLIPTISEMVNGQRVVFTGHSLGAALATIAAAMVATAKTKERITFGSPRVGNSGFAHRAMDGLFKAKRYVHGEDIVPTVPPDYPELGFNFVHVGHEILLKEMPRPWVNIFCPKHIFDHVPTNYCERCWQMEGAQA